MEEASKEKNKICSKIFSRFFLILFFVFMTLHLAGMSGYYEYELHKKVVITEEKIALFEEDIALGKNVDLKDYLDEQDVDYSTNISGLGLYLSDNFSNILKNGLEAAFSFLNRLIEE